MRKNKHFDLIVFRQYFVVTSIEILWWFLEEDIMNFKTASGLLRDESGATAIEYGLIVALLTLASLVALTAMGDALVAVFTRAQTALMDALN